MNQLTLQELQLLDPETQQWAIENGLVEGGTPRVGFGPMIPQDQLGFGYPGSPGATTLPENYNKYPMLNQTTPHTDYDYTGGNVGSPAPVYDTNWSPQASYSSPSPTYAMNNPNPTYSGDPGDSMRNPNYDVTGQEGLLDGAEGGEGLTAGQYQGMAMAGNMAGNMIDTHDKELVDTPMGNRGSYSGMAKGATKGASTGATIGTMVAPGKGTAIGAVIGGTLGLLGGAQGYFDTRTPPQTRTQTVSPIRGAGFSGQATSLFG